MNKKVWRDPIAMEQQDGYSTFIAHLREPKGVLSSINAGDSVGVYGFTEDPRYGTLTALLMQNVPEIGYVPHRDLEVGEYGAKGFHKKGVDGRRVIVASPYDTDNTRPYIVARQANRMEDWVGRAKSLDYVVANPVFKVVTREAIFLYKFHDEKQNGRIGPGVTSNDFQLSDLGSFPQKFVEKAHDRIHDGIMPGTSIVVDQESTLYGIAMVMDLYSEGDNASLVYVSGARGVRNREKKRLLRERHVVVLDDGPDIMDAIQADWGSIGAKSLTRINWKDYITGAL